LDENISKTIMSRKRIRSIMDIYTATRDMLDRFPQGDPRQDD